MCIERYGSSNTTQTATESAPGAQLKHLARRYVRWPHIDQDIQEMVKCCQACQEVKQAPP